MNKLMAFIQKERLYLLLLVFIILVNAIIISAGTGVKAKKISAPLSASGNVSVSKDEKDINALLVSKDEVASVLSKNKTLSILFNLASLLIVAVLLLGILVDVILASAKLSRKVLDINTYKLKPARWNIWDVAKVVILFLFFGYIVIIAESFLLRLFAVLKDDNLRMIVNTSFLDILTAVFILYFTISQYKEKLVSLGLSVKNFFLNVFYGIVGYVALVPVLIAILLIISLVIRLTNYTPPAQPVVDVFLKSKNSTFLIYTSIFTAVLGPVIEELFFRSFMYGAFKKVIGIFWATVLTSMVFALLHTNLVGFLPIMALGILLTFLYEKTGTLVSSITVHVLHNLAMVFFVFLIKEIKA